jgi:four helix bundle protein
MVRVKRVLMGAEGLYPFRRRRQGLDYKHQIRKAARSACYNTSEGFYRYKHGEFGHHLNIARGSLGELQDQLDEGLENKYFTKERHSEMSRLCYRSMRANVKLRESWTRKPGPDL